jgi:hypothetical protein
LSIFQHSIERIRFGRLAGRCIVVDLDSHDAILSVTPLIFAPAALVARISRAASLCRKE